MTMYRDSYHGAFPGSIPHRYPVVIPGPKLPIGGSLLGFLKRREGLVGTPYLKC